MMRLPSDPRRVHSPGRNFVLGDGEWRRMFIFMLRWRKQILPAFKNQRELGT